jgi:hypothetical protein
MKNTKKTLWIKSAAIMLAISAIFLLNAYAGKGPGSGGGGGMNIFDEPTEAACRACHDDLENFPMLLATNPDKHHAAVVLCEVPCDGDECWDCLDCHTLVSNEDLEAKVVSDTDCLDCHDVATIQGSPGSSNRHHDTESAATSCSICHTN